MRLWARAVSPDTNLVSTFGIDRDGALRYVVIVGLLFGLYGAALWLVLCGRVRVSSGVALLYGALFCLTLTLTHPLSSADVFSYIASARMQWVYGDNPLTTAPLAHPDDAFVRLLRSWRDLPSPYGPLWSLLTWLPQTLGGDRPALTVALFKGTSAAFLVAAGALTGMTAERLRRGAGPAAVVMLTWNPLAVWHTAGNGHNDAVMISLLALTAYLLTRGLAGLAVLAFTAAALVKLPAVLLAPIAVVWWWRSGRRPSAAALAPWLVGALALCLAAYAPYWAGRDTLHASLNEGGYFAMSGPAALRGALVRVLDVPAAERIAIWAGRVLFLAGVLLLLRGLRGSTIAPLLATGALLFVLFLLTAAPYFAPWYVLWPLTLAAAVPWRRDAVMPTLALSLGAMSALLWATWTRARFAADPLGDWYPMHLLAFAFTAAPVLAAWWWTAATTRAASLGHSEEQGRGTRHPPVGEAARDVSECPRATGGGRDRRRWP